MKLDELRQDAKEGINPEPVVRTRGKLVTKCDRCDDGLRSGLNCLACNGRGYHLAPMKYEGILDQLKRDFESVVGS